MRRQGSLTLLAVFMLIFVSDSQAKPPNSLALGGKIEIALTNRWRFREAGKADWHAASVPGCVHTDLLANHLIEDPFYRDNEQKQQWIGKTDWEYQTTFSVRADLLNADRIELVFDGLDTYADVYLNDKPLLKADNMFRIWAADCKPLIKAGDNTLRIRFRSPINEILPLMKAMKYELPASNDQGEKTSPHTRKAPYQYGWDWGPRFVTCGIWKPVRLVAWSGARIDDLWVELQTVNTSAAKLVAHVDVMAASALDAIISVATGIEGQQARGAEKPVKLAPGVNRIDLDLVVTSPRLWWPNGLGAQPLYTATAVLKVGRNRLDETSRRIGIRTLELRQQPDKDGKSFTFVVNGVPVFAKGANWIPADSFPNRVNRERYRHLIQSCKDANMNMLRVWGGGYYEMDDFYDLCDEMGILIWQDFMFACSMYPASTEFLESVRHEAIDNVKRLRNHPSIAIWVGNNEIETAWKHWGWKTSLPAALWDDYMKIFHGVLPDVVKSLDPSRPYWPSSPSSNLEEDPDSPRMGDVHYWEVWHASKPFREYERQFPRFMSEYGFQSFPELKTVESYTLTADHNIDSLVMKAHQRHPRGNQLIREYMLRDFPQPRDFSAFLYASQVLQAEGIKIGAEHLRRIMPHNMGSLYWQVDDCWPVASWSSIDYFGRWKALQFYARRFYSDLLVTPHEESGKIAVYVVSDRVKGTPAQLHVALMDFDGNVLMEKKTAVSLAPLASRTYVDFDKSQLLGGRDPQRVFLNCELTMNGKMVSDNRLYFVPYKDLQLPRAKIDRNVRAVVDGYEITLRASRLARAVYLVVDGVDGEFSDNFFDLLPAKSVTIVFKSKSKASLKAVNDGVKVTSLADAF
jgi:beta-mannosidase